MRVTAAMQAVDNIHLASRLIIEKSKIEVAIQFECSQVDMCIDNTSYQILKK